MVAEGGQYIVCFSQSSLILLGCTLVKQIGEQASHERVRQVPTRIEALNGERCESLLPPIMRVPGYWRVMSRTT